MTYADPVQPVPTTPPAADVLLVTVTEVETRAVFAALQATCGRAPTHHHIAAHISYDLGVIAGAQVWLVRSELGTATPGGAFPTITSAIAALQPQAIILVGIAFGVNPAEQRIGDVLVSQQLMLYDLQRIGTGPGDGLRILTRGDRRSSAPPLLGRFRHGALGWPSAPMPGGAPRVQFGLLLSGDKLIDHQGVRDQLAQLEPEVLGGEMEGAGLYLAASAAKVDWIVVKAICDWADGTKGRNKTQHQQRAADNAAAFTFHVLQQGGFGPTARRPPSDAAAILTQLQALLRPTPAPYRATVTRMVEDYTAIFGGREAELAVLDQWLTADTRPFAFLHAPTGRGKTALLIHWVARVQARGDWTVVFVPISLRYQTATEISVLGALGAALAAFHGDKEFTTYNQAPDQLRPLIADYLRREAPAGQRLLLVLDGLDEAIGWRVGRELFPRTPGAHLWVIASAREKAGTTRAHWYAQLGWATPHSCDLGLAGLNQAAVSDVLTRMGNPLDQLATDVDLLTEIARVSAGDPLTIRFLVEALQEGSLTPGRLVGLTEGLEAYVTDWLHELRTRSAEAHTVYALLALCAVALGPLTTDDCMALDADHFTRGVDVERAASMVDRFLIGDGTPEQGYVFSHPQLRELFLERVLTARERSDVQARFVAYGTAWYAERSAPLPDYVRLFWVGHLRRAGQWDQLRHVLTAVVPQSTGWTQPWATARYAAEGSYTGYLSDLAALWEHSDQGAAVPIALRCALIASTVRSLSAQLTPALLVGLVQVGTPQGRWSGQAALETITHMPDPARRRDALLALLQQVPQLPATAILPVVQADPDAWLCAGVLTTLAGRLPADDRAWALTRVLHAAQAVPDAQRRAALLTALVEKLAADDQAGVLAQALHAAQAVPVAWQRAELLTALAEKLPHAVLEAAQTVPDAEWRAELLTALADRLPPDDQAGVLEQALEAAQAVPDAEWRAPLLTALAEKLAADDQAGVLAQALEAAQAVPAAWRRAQLLTALVEKLAADDQAGVLAQALEAAQAVPAAWRRAQLLTALAEKLAADDQAGVLAQALEAAQAEPVAEWRAPLLTALAEKLAADDQAGVLAQALEAAQAEPDAEWRRALLTALADKVPHAMLAVAQAEPEAELRAQLLTALADRLPPDDQAGVLEQALHAALTVPYAWLRAPLLTALAPHLARHATRADFLRTLRVLAARGRPNLLRDLAALMPWLVAITTEVERTEIAQAVIDVGRCWP